MAIRRQAISTELNVDGMPWRVTVTRPFVMNALARRGLSDAEFFEFMARETGTIALLARRKIKRNQLVGGKVELDHQDLPD